MAGAVVEAWSGLTSSRSSVWTAITIAVLLGPGGCGSDKGPGVPDGRADRGTLEDARGGDALDGGRQTAEPTGDAPTPGDGGRGDGQSPDATEDAPVGTDVPLGFDGAPPRPDAAPAGADAPVDPNECRVCPVGQTFCNGRCVAPTDPVLGCGRQCFPCTFANGVGACDQTGACRFERCNAGFGDCNDNRADGCETDLSTTANCTECGRTCTNVCTPVGCADECLPPLTRCGNRCVDLARSPVACGACNGVCRAPAGGSATCVAGRCQTTCAAGFMECPDMDRGTTPGASKCVDLMNDADHCGACGRRCNGDELNVYASCDNGICSKRCLAGWTACGRGCVHLPSTFAHCGACDRACAPDQYCTLGVCRPTSDQIVASGLNQPADLAVVGEEVFFTTLADGGVYRVPGSGGVPEPLTTGQAKPIRLAADATHVYWVNELGGAVMRIARTAPRSPEVVSAAVKPVGITIDDKNVYWAEYGSTSLPIVIKRGVKGTNVRSEELAPGLVTFSLGSTQLSVVGRTLYAWGQSLIIIPLDGGPITYGPNVSGFAVDEHHEFLSSEFGSWPYYNWKSRVSDELAYNRVSHFTAHLVATPCGALFVGGFLPLLPTNRHTPAGASGMGIWFGRPAPMGRVAYSSPYSYWTEPGDGGPNGAIRRVRVPIEPSPSSGIR